MEWINPLISDNMDNREWEIENLYIARDKNGLLSLFSEMPHCNSYNEWVEDDHTCRLLGYLDEKKFPDVKWDNGPIQVKLSLNK